jgi:hypothetical protein
VTNRHTPHALAAYSSFESARFAASQELPGRSPAPTPERNTARERARRARQAAYLASEGRLRRLERRREHARKERERLRRYREQRGRAHALWFGLPCSVSAEVRETLLRWGVPTTPPARLRGAL